MTAIVATGLGCGGSDGGTEPPPTPPAESPAITLALSASAASVAQGGTGAVTVTIGRSGGYTGAVGLALEGAPANVTGTFAPASIPAGQTTSTLTLTAAQAAAAAQTTLTVRATGQGVTARTATVALTVTAVAQPAFTLAVAPAAVTVAQGATGAATVNLTRTGGFAGDVALSVTGAPQGLGVTLAAATTAGNSVGLTLAPGAGLAAGTYTLTVRGTGVGVAGERTAALAVTVTAVAPPVGSIAWSFCGPDAPLWLAVQDGTGAWTRVTATNGTYRFDLPSGRGGVAYTRDNGSGTFTTMVDYGTTAELTAMGEQKCVSATRKSVNGTVAGVGLMTPASISLGGAAGSPLAGQSTFTILNVPDGARDLIATRTAIAVVGGGASMTLDRLIIRRGVNAAAGSTLPVLDFNGAESFAPETRNVTVTGANGESVMLTGMYRTAGSGGAAALLFAETGATGATVRPFFVVPAARQAQGDLHMLVVGAMQGLPNPLGPGAQRTATLLFAAPTDRTAALGPALTQPTVTSLGGGRYRAQIAKQVEYANFWTATFAMISGSGTGNTFTLNATAAYVGAAGTVELTVPDFTGVAGWNTAWGLSGQIFWQTSASGWEGGSITQPMLDGAAIRTGIRSGTL